MKHTIKLSKGQKLSKNTIREFLWDSRLSYQYTRFELVSKKIYISVIFNRDGLVDITTNSRSILLWKELQLLRKMGTISRLSDFVYRWILELNK